YSGTGAQNVGNPAEYGHLIIGGSGEKTVNPGDLTVNGDLTVQSGCSLVVPQCRAVTVEGDLYLNSADGLVLKAGDSVAAPGSFIHNGSVNGTGTVKVERFIPGYLNAHDANYHLISSPVCSQNIQPEFVSDPPESSTDFYRWDEPLTKWINSKTEAGLWNTAFQPGDDRTFRPGCGYLAAYASDVTKSFSGIISNSDLDISLMYTTGEYSGFNLSGNPYTSALNADIHTWTKNNVLNAVWVWDPVSGNYKTWNGLMGTLPGGIIPAMQGFFVKASSASSNLVIPALSRVHSDHPACRSERPRVLNVRLSGGIYRDESVLYFPRPPLELADSMFNVPKLTGFSDAPQLYFPQNSGMFSILQIDTLPPNMSVRIGIRKGIPDTLRFEFSGIQTFSADETICLEDRLEGQIIDLKQQAFYDFVSQQQQENDRFFLLYKNTTGLQPPSVSDQVSMYTEKGDLRIEGLDDFMGCGMLEIFDMAGKRILEQLIHPGIRKICLDLAPAYYIVRLTSGKSSVTKKLLFAK
ncbi:MAG: T9SS C-terminal target domain-containing protein, partial [Bacteroidetes bacterium]